MNSFMRRAPGVSDSHFLPPIHFLPRRKSPRWKSWVPGQDPRRIKENRTTRNQRRALDSFLCFHSLPQQHFPDVFHTFGVCSQCVCVEKAFCTLYTNWVVVNPVHTQLQHIVNMSCELWRPGETKKKLWRQWRLSLSLSYLNELFIIYYLFMLLIIDTFRCQMSLFIIYYFLYIYYSYVQTSDGCSVHLSSSNEPAIYKNLWALRITYFVIPHYLSYILN